MGWDHTLEPDPGHAGVGREKYTDPNGNSLIWMTKKSFINKFFDDPVFYHNIISKYVLWKISHRLHRLHRFFSIKH